MKPHFVKVRKVARCTVLTIPAAIVRKLGLNPGAIAVVHLEGEGMVTVTFYKQGAHRLVEVRALARFGEMLTDNHKSEKEI